MYLWTSEFVSKGHPDKVADQIADAILDAYLTSDPESRVACEVTITKDLVLVTGEVNSQCSPKIEDIVKATLDRIGYDRPETGFDVHRCEIINRLHAQAAEISGAVNQGGRGGELGAGDQGMMFGFATAETQCHMPPAIYLAREIIRTLETDRETNPDTPFFPDAKSQVTLAIQEDGMVDHVHAIVVSACHRRKYQVVAVRDYIKELILRTMLPNLPEEGLRDAFGNAQYILNPAGAWHEGGPASDTGLSGRKIVVDNYGADCPIGGGSFSGKDASKVDRSGAYAARHIAKNLVAAGLGQRAQVQVAYAIGRPQPVSLRVQVHDGLQVRNYSDQVRECVPLTPRAIIERFHLNRPIFSLTAAGGHFGRTPQGDSFGWERLDVAEVFRSGMQ
jgi:S-adenosylmethionine synthetase